MLDRLCSTLNVGMRYKPFHREARCEFLCRCDALRTCWSKEKTHFTLVRLKTIKGWLGIRTHKRL